MAAPQQDERPLPTAAAAALSLGRFVEAIKQVRQAEGLDLAQAKARVEAHLQRAPGLKAQVDAELARMKRTVMRWVIVIDVILFAAVLWWIFRR